ncbi:MAG: hypothetical protein CBC24_05365 [Candidatus Pelagibacter sp. TMED64]|nr:cell envelope biogenesis protein LolA [Candidatus Pelagibacter sp.]OUU65555.1 MAG: hypothetical protein CBC24_05365 [Candidatus Pelagibacter sp. TMED64]
MKLYKKKFIILFLIIFNTSIVYAQPNNKIIQKIKDTNTLSFNFKQTISDKVENGKCLVKYPKQIICDYNDSFKKRLISDGKRLAIIQRRYNKIFYYRLKSTPLNLILNKVYLIKFIKNNEPYYVNNNYIFYKIKTEDNKELLIFFDKKTFNLGGWETNDLYQNKVKFIIENIKTNIHLEKKIFKIPREEEL